jgi:hypothetical protein
MSLLIEKTETFEAAAQDVFAAALGAVAGLEGNVLSSDAAALTIDAKFNKTIHGRTLGDRTQLQISITPAEEGGGCVLALMAFPLNAVGQRLQFGARAGVTETVVSWFLAHIAHRLKAEKPAAK